MPIYEYLDPNGSVEEHIFSYNGRPPVLQNGAVLIPSSPSPAVYSSVERKAMEKRGVIIREPGVEQIAVEARKSRVKKRDKQIREGIEKALRDHAFSASETITGD